MIELSLKTSFGYTVAEFETVLDYLSRKALPLDFLVTRTISLEQVQETFENQTSGAMTDMKTIIYP